MSQHRTRLLADFWARPLEERAELLRELRDGGSVPAALVDRVRDEAWRGRLELLERAEVVAAVPHPDSTFTTADSKNAHAQNPAPPTLASRPGLTLMLSHDTGETKPVRADWVFLATGYSAAVPECALLRQLYEVAPVELVDGIPALGQHLQWRPDVPVHIMGAAAGLQLGPGAVNLIGARAGAERLAAVLDAVPGGNRLERRRK